MKIKAIGFVAIPVTDIKRARAFYENVLGLSVAEEMMGGQWIEYSVGEDTLAIANVGDTWTPSDQGTAAAFEVEDFADAIKRLKDRHVPFAAEPFETPHPAPDDGHPERGPAMNEKPHRRIATEVGEDRGQMLPGGVDAGWEVTAETMAP